MSTHTPNFNLEKPDVDEFYDVGVLNANMDKIDLNIKDVSDEIEQHLTDVPTKLKAGHVKLQGDYINGALQNGWQGSFSYAKNDLGIVSIKFNGYSKVPVGGTVIATLPQGYRPKAAIIMPITTDINGGIKFLIIGEGSAEIMIPADSSLEANRVYLGGATFYGGE